MTEPVDWSVLRALADEVADPTIAADVVARFLAELAGRVEALRTAVAGESPAALRAAAHALKGAGAAVGAPRLHRCCRDVEVAAAQGDLEAAAARAADAVAECGRVEAALRAGPPG